jgi:hypothetical protein
MFGMVAMRFQKVYKLRIGFRVAVLVASCFPHSCRLIRLHAWPADLLDEQSTGDQSCVSQHLAIHAKPGAMRQQAVFRILLNLLRSRARGLPVCRRHHQLLVEALHVPIVLAEIQRQPIQQFRMTGSRAHDSEILSGLHKPVAKQFRPHAIHGYASSQRIHRADGPFGQRQAIQRGTRRQTRQKMRHAWPHSLFSRAERSTCKYIGICQRRRLFADDDDIAAFGQAAQFPVERRNLSS